MNGKIQRGLDILMLILAALLTHQTSLVPCEELRLGAGGSCNYGGPVLQLGTLAGLVLLSSWLLRANKNEKDFVAAMRRNLPLVAYLILAVVSLGWSVYLPATIYRAVLLVLVTLLAAYLGLRVTTRDLLIYVAAAVGVIGVASLLLGLFLPEVGIMTNHPYEGLWRGIFWHKIYLGATMALGYMASLVILFSPRREYGPTPKILAALLAALSISLAILSDSASGLVVFVIQTVLVALLLAWLAWGHRIPRRAYPIIAVLAALALLLVFTNLESVFKLFNRSANMTGRLPMWMHVWNTYAIDHLAVGHGFGAFWLRPGINETVQSAVGWGYPVRVSDNGYLDVILDMGLVGLALVIAIIAMAFVRAIPQAIKSRSLTDFFPVLVLVHLALINISLSYLVAIESFIWFLLILILFMGTRVTSGRAASSGRPLEC